MSAKNELTRAELDSENLNRISPSRPGDQPSRLAKVHAN